MAAVTRLLSRQEMMSNPAARTAIRKEAEGLIQKGTWKLDTVTERDELTAGATKRVLRSI